jgi:hypothetical protein
MICRPSAGSFRWPADRCRVATDNCRAWPEKELYLLLINHIEHFLFWFRIPSYSNFCAFCILSTGYTVQIHAASSQFIFYYTQPIFSLSTGSLREYAQRNPLEDLPPFSYSAKAHRFIPRILSLYLTSFRASPVYVQIHSVYSENAPCWICLFEMKIFSSQLLKEHWSEGEIMDSKPTWN